MVVFNRKGLELVYRLYGKTMGPTRKTHTSLAWLRETPHRLRCVEMKSLSVVGMTFREFDKEDYFSSAAVEALPEHERRQDERF